VLVNRFSYPSPSTSPSSGYNKGYPVMPSFRIALAMEKAEWKLFRKALDKSDRKKFDEVFDVPRFYIVSLLLLK
jgi:hypothetical protein